MRVSGLSDQRTGLPGVVGGLNIDKVPLRTYNIQTVRAVLWLRVGGSTAPAFPLLISNPVTRTRCLEIAMTLDTKSGREEEKDN